MPEPVTVAAVAAVRVATFLISTIKADIAAQKASAQAARLQTIRQNFTADQIEKILKQERDEREKDRQTRLKIALQGFEEQRNLAEWTIFLQNWPLANLPMVIDKKQAATEEQATTLRVIWARNEDDDFESKVFPDVEDELQQFAEIYINRYELKNVSYFLEAFKPEAFRGAAANIRHVLKTFPTVVVETKIVTNKIVISITLWGLGNGESRNTRLYEISYKKRGDDEYYAALARTLSAYLKFVIGYIYDAYNFLENNGVPLLPKTANNEIESGCTTAILNDVTLKAEMSCKYRELYESALGSDSPNAKEQAAFLPELRLNYAVATRDVVDDPEFYAKMLNDSLTAWAALRSAEEATQFLPDLTKSAENDPAARRYFSESDADYFRRLSESAKNSTTPEFQRLVGALQTAKEAAETAFARRFDTAENAGDRQTLEIDGVKYAFRWCPPGEFLMGDGTQHQVKLTRGFWLLETQVAQAMWRSITGANPSRFHGDDLPVEKVSWNDCQDFIAKLQSFAPDGWRFSLPTEAQWEYACRARTEGPYGSDGTLGSMGWYDDNSGGATHDVGQKSANAWELFDMHGNVWEWCADWYGSYPSGSVTDPTGPSSGSFRVLRGGGWDYYASDCRSACRSYNDPSSRNYSLGLRLALVRL